MFSCFILLGLKVFSSVVWDCVQLVYEFVFHFVASEKNLYRYLETLDSQVSFSSRDFNLVIQHTCMFLKSKVSSS